MEIHPFLLEERPLPGKPAQDNIVSWHVFRSPEAAADFVPAVRLGAGQRLIGGRGRDSIGEYWWVGVQVDDIERWGNRAAVNKRDL